MSLGVIMFLSAVKWELGFTTYFYSLLIFGVLVILYFVLWHLFIVVECFLVEKQSVRDVSGYALNL